MKSDKKNRSKRFPDVTEGGREPSFTDPQGSYTGIPEDRRALPVQDADDL